LAEDLSRGGAREFGNSAKYPQLNQSQMRRIIRMRDNKKHNFIDQGVSIILPEVENRDLTIRAYFPPPPVSKLPWDEKKFKLKRIMFDFEIFDRNKKEVVTEFQNNPFELRVYFTSDDQAEVTDPDRKLTIAFWDKNEVDEIKWKKITGDEERVNDESIWKYLGFVGYIKAEIKVWPDPPIALGL
jgi:hypothetical protein